MYIEGTTEAVWEQLRTTRSDPPAATVGSQERRRTYVFALEEAEQLFRAAEQVGTATRPLLLFYGLNQAGRAIAAAASKISKDDRWKLAGHGIHTVPASLSDPLYDVLVYADKAGSNSSFVRLSELLDSSLWGKAEAVRLNKLWDNLPENRLSPLNDEGESRRTPLYVVHSSLFWEPHPLVNAPVADFPSWVVNSPQVSPASFMGPL